MYNSYCLIQVFYLYFRSTWTLSKNLDLDDRFCQSEKNPCQSCKSNLYISLCRWRKNVPLHITPFAKGINKHCILAFKRYRNKGFHCKIKNPIYLNWTKGYKLFMNKKAIYRYSTYFITLLSQFNLIYY